MKPNRLLEEFRRTVLRVREIKKMGTMLDYFIVSESLDSRCEKGKVFEGYGSKPHKLVRCEIRLSNVDKWNKEQKCQASFPRPVEGMLVWNGLIRRLTDREEEVKRAECKKQNFEEVEDEYSHFLEERLAFGPHPVGTRNPKVLGSSAPTPEEPLRRRGAQGVVWVKPSRLDPQSWCRRYCGQHYYILRCRTLRTPCQRLRLRDHHRILLRRLEPR